MFNNKNQVNVVESKVGDLKKELVSLGGIKSNYEDDIKKNKSKLEKILEDIDLKQEQLDKIPDVKPLAAGFEKTKKQLASILNETESALSDLEEILESQKTANKANEEVIASLLKNTSDNEKLSKTKNDYLELIEEMKATFKELDEKAKSELQNKDDMISKATEEYNNNAEAYEERLTELSESIVSSDDILESTKKQVDEATSSLSGMEKKIIKTEKELVKQLEKKNSDAKTEYEKKLLKLEEREGLVSNRESYLEDKIKTLKTVKADLEKIYGKPLNNIKL